MKIAIIQAKPTDGIFDEKNLDCAVKFLENCEESTDIACFPEGYPSKGLEEISAKAEENDMYVLASFIKESNQFTALIEPDGEVIGEQKKTTHYWAFDPEVADTGRKLNIFYTDIGRIGVVKCWDIVYPEVTAFLANENSDIIFNLVNWNSNLIGLWHNMLIARSFENWIPIIGVNTAHWQKETLNYRDKVLKPEYGGGSIVVTPEKVDDLSESAKRSFGNEDFFTLDRMVRRIGYEEKIMYTNINIEDFRNVREEFLQWKKKNLKKLNLD